MTKVTIGLLLKEEREGESQYDPAPGTEYEVGPNVFVTLKGPTIKLQKAFIEQYETLDKFADELEERRDEKTKGDERLSDADYVEEMAKKTIETAKMVTEGSWPPVEDVYRNVAHRITEDFTYASRLIVRQQTEFSPALLRLVTSLLSARDGHVDMEKEKKD